VEDGFMAIASFMVPLGSPVPAFRLPSIDGAPVSAGDFADASALLVVFLSNHCPYVRRIETAIGALTTEYEGKGLATVAVCSNDVANYPDDGADHLREQAKRAGFRFPYLVDASQETAKAFKAACTPDFFLYGRERTLAYRGEFDGARPRNDVVSDGASLRAALDLVLTGKDVPEPHTASLGCGIKWKPGNEPV
jgi:peroxiredoxin